MNTQILAGLAIRLYGATACKVPLVHELPHPRKGDFLLHDHNWSDCPVAYQEKGIFINEHLFVPINWYAKPKMISAKELREQNVVLPTLYELLQLRNAKQEVNAALRAVKLDHLVFIPDVLASCWSVERLKTAEDDEVCRLVEIEMLKLGTRPKSEVINDGAILLINGCELLVRTPTGYQAEEFKLFASCGEIQLFMGGDKMVFQLEKGQMKYLGYFNGLKEDVLWVGSGVYQVLPGRLQILCQKHVINVHFEESGLLLVHQHEEETCGDQFWQEDHYLFFSRVEGGFLRFDHEEKN